MGGDRTKAQSRTASQKGEQLVRGHVISQADLDKAHRIERESGTPWYRQLLQSQKLSFGAVNDLLLYEFHSRSKRESHQSLGEALVHMKALSKERLAEALSQQKRNGKLLGAILLENGFVSREDVGRALAKQYALDYVDLADAQSDSEALEAVPESVAKQNRFIPIAFDGDKLTVLISGPEPPDRLKRVGILLGYRIHTKVTAAEDLEGEIFARYHGKTSPNMAGPNLPSPNLQPTHVAPARVPDAPTAPLKAHVVQQHVDAPLQSTKPRSAKPQSQPTKFEPTKRPPTPAQTPHQASVHQASSPLQKEKPRVEVPEKVRFEEIVREAQGAPVVKLVSTIIEGAVNSGATDIHLDPQEPEMRVRYRIDGVLHDVMSIPREIEAAIVSRLKIMADVDITETRHPQDGHIRMVINDGDFDIRVATMPTYLGERVVLRLLDQSSVLQGIRDLGLEPEDEKTLIRVIEQPYGMVLVTGPTGSGKTTTLYSCLNEKDVMTDSIVTLEDPIEYQLSGINQVQIDSDIKLTFANALRAALRQDIDVLLVGEIRDPETARIAIRAAMTGHLVFSTLHTNDAPEAISTLRNMDIPSYLIASALTAIVGQRLVRKICENCKESFTPPKTLLKSTHLPETTKKLYRGTGCEVCYHTGTRGRTGIFEILEITPQVRGLIGEDASANKVTTTAKLKTMSDRCRVKVKQGIIAPEEFLRVIRT